MTSRGNVSAGDATWWSQLTGEGDSGVEQYKDISTGASSNARKQTLRKMRVGQSTATSKNFKKKIKTANMHRDSNHKPEDYKDRIRLHYTVQDRLFALDPGSAALSCKGFHWSLLKSSFARRSASISWYALTVSNTINASTHVHSLLLDSFV